MAMAASRVACGETLAQDASFITSLVEAPPSSLTARLWEEGHGVMVRLLDQAVAEWQEGDWQACRGLAEELGQISWEALHSGTSWRDVSTSVREVYGRAQALLVATDVREGRLEEGLRRLDLSLLMSPPESQGSTHALIQRLTTALDEVEGDEEDGGEGGRQESPHRAKRPRPSSLLPNAPPPCSLDQDAIPRLACPALHVFLDHHMQADRPVILTGCMDGWPAMGLLPQYQARAWRDLEYLRKQGGRRTVPVEVGDTYLGDQWGQKLMTLSQFLDQYLLKPSHDDPSEHKGGGQERGYLAQHELFQQIPVLRRDILIPDYCALETEDKGDDFSSSDVIVQAWLGPRGTISPAHTDPYHNLLAQVVGSKYVRIFPPSETPKMYPHDGMMSNSSMVDVEAPDLDRYPKFAEASYLECVLHAGEMLYLPPYFWHYIRSREVSFSVSFWWGKRPPPGQDGKGDGVDA